MDWKFLEDNLLWLGPTGLFVLTMGLRQLRLWLLSLRKKPEPPAEPTPVEPAPDYQYSTAPPAPVEPVNPVEAYYRAHRRELAVCEREIALVNQKAQFEVVERNNPQLVTIYDPADVKAGGPIAKTEDFPLDDIRRKNDSGHPAAGMLHEEMVVIDYRPLPNALVPGFMPKTFAEKYQEKARARADAIRQAAIKTARPDGFGGPVGVVSADPVTQADIEAHKEYSSRIRDQARRDFEELKPQIKADAEKMAREKFVPPREQEFRQEADERGVPYEQVVEEFVRKVGEDAVWAAEARFQKAGPLDESNQLLKNLTGERMRKAGAWQY